MLSGAPGSFRKIEVSSYKYCSGWLIRVRTCPCGFTTNFPLMWCALWKDQLCGARTFRSVRHGEQTSRAPFWVELLKLFRPAWIIWILTTAVQSAILFNLCSLWQQCYQSLKIKIFYSIHEHIVLHCSITYICSQFHPYPAWACQPSLVPQHLYSARREIIKLPPLYNMS